MKRRPSVLIYMQILELLHREPRGPTKLAQGVNIAYDRLAEYAGNLERKGLVRKETIEGKEAYAITSEGVRLYQDWEKVWERLRP